MSGGSNESLGRDSEAAAEQLRKEKALVSEGIKVTIASIGQGVLWATKLALGAAIVGYVAGKAFKAGADWGSSPCHCHDAHEGTEEPAS